MPMTKARIKTMTTSRVVLTTISIGFNLNILVSQFGFPQKIGELDIPWKCHPLSYRVLLLLLVH